MRFPSFTETFYKKTFNELDKQIKACFEDELGPGDTPNKRKNQKIFGAIIPNDKYPLSGPCSAWAFKEIGESEFPDSYIILGINNENDSCYLSTEDWETPLGKIKNDKELASILTKNLKFIKENNEIHRDKHEIEVQLPFLQFVSKDKLHDLKILPINIGKINLEQIKGFADLLEGLDRDVCVIASTNLSRTEDKNKKLIDAIKDMDSKKILSLIDEEKINIEGTNSIITCLEIVKSFGSKWPRILREYHSTKLEKNYENMVGYASICFE